MDHLSAGVEKRVCCGALEHQEGAEKVVQDGLAEGRLEGKGEQQEAGRRFALQGGGVHTREEV